MTEPQQEHSPSGLILFSACEFKKLRCRHPPVYSQVSLTMNLRTPICCGTLFGSIYIYSYFLVNRLIDPINSLSTT